MVVENDSDCVAEVVAGQFFPCFGTFGVHSHIYDRSFQLVEIVVGIGYDITTQRCFAAFTGFQGD